MRNHFDPASLVTLRRPEPSLHRTDHPGGLSSDIEVLHEVVRRIPQGHRNNIDSPMRLFGSDRDEVADKPGTRRKRPHFGLGSYLTSENNEIEIHGTSFPWKCGTITNVSDGCDEKPLPADHRLADTR